MSKPSPRKKPTARKPEKKPAKDRRKPGYPVRIRYRMSLQMKIVAERNDSSLAEEVNIAVRERLERLGLWPPAQ
jgi:hypothetical protein